MHGRVALVLLAALSAAATGCTRPASDYECDLAASYKPGLVYVRLETENGNVTLELDGAKAPRTVCNFLGLVETGFYDGTAFHRVVRNVLVQGGGCTTTLEPKVSPFPAVPNEARSSGLSNVNGTVAMARTTQPDSATSQFFINLKDNPHLDPGRSTAAGYAVFGRVAQGRDVAEGIGAAATQATDDPTDPCRPTDDQSPVDPVALQRARVTLAPA